MLNLKKSKRFDLLDEFHDTSWYLGDIITIDNLEYANIFPIYIQENFIWIKQILWT